MATIARKGKIWQVQIRRVGHKPICRTFKTKGEAKVFGRDVEARLDRGEVLGYDDMTVAGLVRAILDETDDGRLLTAAYRTSLNEQWILDVEATIRPLYGHQEGAELGYNRRSRGGRAMPTTPT